VTDRRPASGRESAADTISEVRVVSGAGVERTDRNDGADTAPEPARVLRLAMRIAIHQLASGAQTDDVEAAVRDVAHRYGIRGV